MNSIFPISNVPLFKNRTFLKRVLIEQLALNNNIVFLLKQGQFSYKVKYKEYFDYFLQRKPLFVVYQQL